ncbi:FadR/GntR family transcriptional regulator [Gordonia sp. NPDC003429]
MGKPTSAGSDTSRSPRASERVAHELRRRIVAGEIAEGFPLPPEAELLKEFGVSRPTLREALRVLDSESLLEVRRGSRGGALVSTPNVETAARYLGVALEYRAATIDDVFAAACALEGACAAILARTRTPDQVAALDAAVCAERDAADDEAALITRQLEFHRLILEFVDNVTLRVLVGQLRDIIDVATRQHLVEPALSADTRAEAGRRGIRAHAKLVKLVEARDASAAEALWRRQVAATGAYLKESGIGDSVLDLLS